LIIQAPATKPEVAPTERIALHKEISPGARNNPRAQVKITREERRGLVNENRSKITSIFLSEKTTDETKRVVII
jgi:hypothetical protein